MPEEACYVHAPLEFQEAYLVPPVLKLYLVLAPIHTFLNSGSNFYCQQVVSHHLWNLTLSFAAP